MMRNLNNLFSTHNIGCSKDANIYINSRSNKNITIYNAVDLQKYRKTDSAKNNIINIATIGRMSEQKNPLFIIDIIYELKKLRNDFKFTYIGAGDLFNEVKEKVKKLKCDDVISLLGYRNDVDKILENIDFLLLPSRYEGLGIVLVEAQAMKVPCFISDIIPNDADLGLCTKISLSNTARQWAEIINNHINNKTYNDKINTKKLNEYKIDNVMKKYESVYLGVI